MALPNESQFGQLSRSHEFRNNVKRFNEGVDSVYGGPDIYGDNPGFNFGFRQPYVWVKPNDSNFKKYIKKFDSRSFPIGSTIQDAERIGKFLLSGKGIFFLASQFLIQGQNAFNETSLYNPLSVPLSVLRPASLGLLPRTIRHFPINGSDAIGQLLGRTNTSAPQGTLRAAVDGSKVTGGGKGLQRARTTVNATYNFDLKYGASSSSLNKSLLSTFASMISPNLAPLPVQKGKFKLYDTEAFKKMVENTEKNTGQFIYYSDKGYTEIPLMPFGKEYSGNNKREVYFNNNSIENTKNDKVVWNYTDKLYSKAALSDEYGILKSKILDKWKTAKVSLNKNGDDKDKLVDNISKELLSNFAPNIKKYSELPNSKNDNRVFDIPSAESEGDNFVKIKKLYENLKSSLFYPDFQTIEKIPKSTYVDGKYIQVDDNSYQKNNQKNLTEKYGKSYNKETWEVLYGFKKDDTKDGRYFDEINNKSISNERPKQEEDFILVYFYDIVNDKYIHCRAANLKFNNHSVQSDWDPVRYLGRADNIFIYKGISQRTFSPSFTIYASSKNEMNFIYKKMNYLQTMCFPSQYHTTGLGKENGGYMVPPFVRFTVGRLFEDQPAILRSVDVSWDDTFSWDIDDYKVPMGMNITVALDILERVAPRAGVSIYGNGPNDSFYVSDSVSTN
jgi:hypothetical protein